MTVRQQVGAALVGTTVLAGAASAVPAPGSDPLAMAAAYAQAACPQLDRAGLVTATAIAAGESGARPEAVGDTTITDRTWGASYGLWQIRSLRAQDGTGLARDASRLGDPAFNARAMCEVSGGGSNWQPWTVYTSGAYRSHLPDAERAVDAATAGLAALPAGPASPTGTPPLAGPGGGHDGLTLRITDALLGQALDGWNTLNGRVQARRVEAPDLARVLADVDVVQRRYTEGGAGPVPGASSALAGTGQVASSSQMVCPIAGPVEYRADFGDPRSGGRSHAGNDLFAAHGTPVVAPFDAVVTDVADDEGTAGLGGLAVWLRAEAGPLAGWEAYLAHNSKNVARVGERVRAGQVVAYVGDTGNASSDSPQVHLQLHPAGGKPVDPYPHTEPACRANRKVTA